MRIKYKLFAGFLLINLMLIVAGAMSIYELLQLRNKTISTIDANYIALNRLNTMLKAVETEDKSVLLLLLGQWEDGRKQLSKADSTFRATYREARSHVSGNIALDNIGKQYTNFKHIWEMPIVDTRKEGNLTWYYEVFIPEFQKTTSQIEKAMSYSRNQMHSESKQIFEESYTALMPGIVAIISAILMSLLMYFFISRFFSLPINNILKGLKEYNTKKKVFRVSVNTNDELKELSGEIKKALGE
jgi:CHASE3 domain sensor protein